MAMKLVMLAALAAAGTCASAASVLQLDLNTLNAQAVDENNVNGFDGLNHTGSILLSSNASSTLADMLVNGNAQNIAAGQMMSFSGQIDLNNGDVVGGSFTLTLTDASTFTASIVGGHGQVNTQAGQGYSIDGLITSALFSSNPFAGVDISQWFSAQPLTGSFLEFAFSPNGSGFDGNTNLDIFVLVPSPIAGGMAGVGLMGLAARRRRA